MESNAKKYKRLLKDTVIFAIGSVGSRLILFFLVPLYAKYLSTEEYGISNLVFTIGQFLIPILSLEVYDAVLRFGLSKSYKKEDVLYNSLTIVAIDVLICFLLYPVIGLYKPIYEWRIYLFAYFLLNIAHLTIMNYLKVCDRNKAYALMSLLQTLTLCIANIITIVWLKLGISGYLLSNIIALTVSTLSAAFIGKIGTSIHVGSINKYLLKEMIKYSSPLIINSVSWWLISSSDKIMIESMVDASSLGIYTVASKIPALINVIISIFQQAWGISSIKEVESTNDTKFFSNTFKYYCFIVFMASVLLLSIIRTFMNVYVGSNTGYETAADYVPLLLVSAVFSAISTFYGSLYTALKKTNRIMITTLIAGIINIIVNYMCIKAFGTMGAVIGTLTAYLVTVIIRIIDMNQYIPIEMNMIKFIGNSVLIFAFAIIVTVSHQDNVIVSFGAIILFFVINYKDLLSLIKRKRKIE